MRSGAAKDKRKKSHLDSKWTVNATPTTFVAKIQLTYIGFHSVKFPSHIPHLYTSFIYKDSEGYLKNSWKQKGKHNVHFHQLFDDFPHETRIHKKGLENQNTFDDLNNDLIRI